MAWLKREHYLEQELTLIPSNLTDIPSYIINFTQIPKFKATQIDNTSGDFFLEKYCKR